MARIPRRFNEIVESLAQGATPREAAKFPADMARVMSACLEELDMPWQTCVALCYVARGYEEKALITPEPIDPLVEFLAAKDTELDRHEFENSRMAMLIKRKAARV